MNLTTETYAEICKQSSFICALVAGFSFAFLGSLLISSIKSKIINLVMSFSFFSIAGLLICSLVWTLTASRMIFYIGSNITQVPQSYLDINRILSLIFILSFLSFLVTLGLSGWIKSRNLGLVSTIISLISTLFFFVIMKQFVV